MLELVRAFDAKAVERALRENPALLDWRDERGRNWLHVCCGVNPKDRGLDPKRGIETVKVLLAHGLDVNQEAFREGAWKATPLWHAIGRGRNLALARFLLERGSSANYCLWTASFNRDLEAIRLLVRHGADVNDPSVDESPLLGAVKWSHFDAAEALLELGADPNYRDESGMTALHYMLKKSSEKKHFRMLIAHGARGDIPDAKGVTAAQILRKKRDPDFRRMADQLGSAAG
jgi:ankyrin repeat protein